MTDLPLRVTEERGKKIDRKLLFGQVHVADSLDLLHDRKVLLREVERLKRDCEAQRQGRRSAERSYRELEAELERLRKVEEAALGLEDSGWLSWVDQALRNNGTHEEGPCPMCDLRTALHPDIPEEKE